MNWWAVFYHEIVLAHQFIGGRSKSYNCAICYTYIRNGFPVKQEMLVEDVESVEIVDFYVQHFQQYHQFQQKRLKKY